MTVPSPVDAALVEWGERLFYPGNRIVKLQRRRASPPSRSAIAPQPCEPAWKRPSCGERLR